MGDVEVRPAHGTADIEAAGTIVAEAYAADGLAGDDYRDRIRDASDRAANALLLVAVDEASGDVLGSVTYARAGTPYAQICRPGGAEFRMLGVRPQARGRGVGDALVRACLDQAAADDAIEMALSTMAEMQAAHRIYGRLGFVRTPERDWSPVPGTTLITFVKDLRTVASTP